jgi:chromosome partitioning protein
MGSIIAVANQKGGVGKTTTAINLAASLAAAEKSTLLVDCDPQGNATTGVGIDRNALEKGLYEFLLESAPEADVLLETALPGLCAIGASANSAPEGPI